MHHVLLYIQHQYTPILISSTSRTRTSTKFRNSQNHRHTCFVTTETSSVCHRGYRAMAWVSTAGPKPQLPITPINLNHSLLTPQIERPLSKYSVKRLAMYFTQFWLVSRYPWQQRTTTRHAEAGFLGGGGGIDRPIHVLDRGNPCVDDPRQ